ncbi:unnamed protein product [Trypanosoma congolense IL3000]|uniref:WGS project CAEQ00000000 data, annotated contig 864 n=1 Tax=Trypanosoma congolense (strain IL3000) TaxID=1068625 RepID=F9WJ29_TRYCI|nr:unnamed protein product [Trypanosoma congolense IL3000]
MSQCSVGESQCMFSFSSGPFSAVALDLDGTILNNDHNVSTLTKATLYDLSSCGVHIIIVTGRPRQGVKNIEDSLSEYFFQSSRAVDCSTCTARVRGFHLISSNGARIFSPSGNLIYQQNIDSDVVRSIYERFAGGELADELLVSVHQTDAWWISKALPEEWLLKKYGSLPRVRKDVLSEFPVEGVGKICLRSHDKQLLDRYQKEADMMFGYSVITVMTSNHGLDIMARGVSKASGLKLVGEILNFDLSRDVIAFGDSLNDKDMLSTVAKGCIMRNGRDELKELLPHVEVIGGNTEDGVAQKLREVFMLN